MKAKTAKTSQAIFLGLLSKLGEAMDERDYTLVDEMLTTYPLLIRHRDGHCEEPLIMAIRRWDPRLVSICMKHGSSPQDTHQCSKDSKPKNAYLIASNIFTRKIKNLSSDSKQYKLEFARYREILHEMVCTQPFKASGS